MKIISKWKGFYDYKVTKYGVDEKLIFDRRNQFLSRSMPFYDANLFHNPENALLHSLLYIGDEIIHTFIGKNNIFTEFDIKEIQEIKYKYSRSKGEKYIFGDSQIYTISSFFGNKWGSREFYQIRDRDFSRNGNIFKEIVQNINQEIHLNEIPIILVQKYIQNNFAKRSGKEIKYEIFTNPNLSQFGIYFEYILMRILRGSQSRIFFHDYELKKKKQIQGTMNSKL